MTEEQFNDWYKKQFNNLNEKPPVEVWNNISGKLDIQAVWKNIDSKLNSIARRKIILRRTAYTIPLLLLLLFIGNYIINSGNAVEHKISIANKPDKKTAIKNNLLANEYVPSQKEKNKRINSHLKNDKTENQSSVSNTMLGVKTNASNATELSSVRVNKSSNKTSSQNIGEQSSLLVNESSEQIKSLKMDPQPSVTKYESIVNTETVKDTFVEIKNENSTKDKDGYIATTTDNTILLTTKNEELLLFSIKNSFIPVTAIDSTIPQLVPNNSVVYSDFFTQLPLNNEFHGLYAGGIISGNNIWLFNQLSFNGFNSKSLEETNFNFGYAYGITCGYNFNSNFAGELNWYINSQQGQTYHRYNEGQYKTSHVKLNYSIVNFTLKHRKKGISRWFNVPKSNNLIVGINCGFLINSSDDSEFKKTKSLYSSTDYGLRLGYEYEILAFKRIIVSSALNGDFGLKNIYKGNSLTPGSFNRTHTASLGLQLGIKYLFR